MEHFIWNSIIGRLKEWKMVGVPLMNINYIKFSSLFGEQLGSIQKTDASSLNQQAQQNKCSKIYVWGYSQIDFLFSSLPPGLKLGSLTWPTVTDSYLIFQCPVLPLYGKAAQKTNLIIYFPVLKLHDGLLHYFLNTGQCSKLATQGPINLAP